MDEDEDEDADENILVVDDEQFNIEVIRLILLQKNLRCASALSGTEALQLIHERAMKVL